MMHDGTNPIVVSLQVLHNLKTRLEWNRSALALYLRIIRRAARDEEFFQEFMALCDDYSTVKAREVFLPFGDYWSREGVNSKPWLDYRNAVNGIDTAFAMRHPEYPCD